MVKRYVLVRVLKDNTYSVVNLDVYYDNFMDYYPVAQSDVKEDMEKIKVIVEQYGERAYYDKVSNGLSPRQQITKMLRTGTCV